VDDPGIPNISESEPLRLRGPKTNKTGRKSVRTVQSLLTFAAPSGSRTDYQKTPSSSVYIGGKKRRYFSSAIIYMIIFYYYDALNHVQITSSLLLQALLINELNRPSFGDYAQASMTFLQKQRLLIVIYVDMSVTRPTTHPIAGNTF
jgi:hypothetical protein